MLEKVSSKQHKCLFVLQVTKQTVPQANGDANGTSSPGNPANAKMVAAPPGVRTLLEFVAWVVYTRDGRGLHRQLTGWLRGHGGYLSDALPAVNEAAIRVQVSTPELCGHYCVMDET